MHKIKGLIACLSFLFLVGCQQSVEDQLQESKEILEDPVSMEIVKPNEEREGLSFHLPANLTIKDSSPSNIILEGEDQTYIVFFNPLEKADSTSLYEEEKKRRENSILTTSKETKEGFYYSFIDEHKEDDYQLVIGRGGIKVTTETNDKTVLDSVETMLAIVRSSKIVE